ncbi:MAG: 1-acyl-sn-glycerol-3-phosphate acyltransferase [Sandaracinaceae bacterium]|nr:1-acyl-sn-glycerol-3-phosphate acyltransferase [Sandaracinaceae bacterium]
MRFQKLRRFVKLTFVGLCFLVFWAGSAVFSWLALPFFVAFRKDKELVARRAQHIIRVGFELFFGMVRGLGVVDHDTRKHHPQHRETTPVVYVANHPTLFDVIILMASYTNVCCVVKSSVYNGHAVGRILRYGSQIDGDTSTPAQIQRVLNECADRIARGYSVLIFPEGTRSPKFGLNPFGRIAFEVASRAGVAVVPIFLSCDPPALMRGMPWHSMPNECLHYEVAELPAAHVGKGRKHVLAAQSEIEALLRDRVAGFAMNHGESVASNDASREDVGAYV